MDPVLAVLFGHHETALWLVSVASAVVAVGSWLLAGGSCSVAEQPCSSCSLVLFNLF